MTEMTKGEREQLIRLVKARARQAEREAEMREKVLLAEVQNDLTATYERHDALWADAVSLAEEVVEKANTEIAARSLDLGIPAKHAPRLMTGWLSRSPEYSDRSRRAELRKLAETRLAALTKTAKTAIQGAALEAETKLVMGGLQSSEAQEALKSLPTVEALMPPLSIDDLGVAHWQPPEDAAGQLTTALTPTDRKRRRVPRAIEANPGVSDRKIAQIAGVDHKTVAAARRERGGEIPAISGEIPSPSAEVPITRDDDS